MTIRIAGLMIAMGVLVASAPALADGDAANGEKVFRKCKACHAVEQGVNRVGPSMFGVVDRPIASAEGFKYSEAMTAYGAGKTWTAELIDAYLAKPKELVPGNKMGFPGLKKDTDRADVIAYMATLK